MSIPRPGSQEEKNSSAPSDKLGSQENEVTSPHGIPQQPDLLMLTPTHHTEKTALGYSLAGISARDRTTREGKGGHVFVVGWDGEDDPMNPHNFSQLVRVGTTLMVAAIAFVVTASSSIDAAILPQAAAEFGVSEVVEALATGNYLIGFGIGALFAGPLSETFGRNLVYIGSLVLFSIFIMASGLAPNIGAQITFRFLAGFFGSPPLTCAGGTVSDLWNPLEKTYAFPLFAISGFGGPTLGPVIGSYMGTGAPSWRWTEWVILIISGTVLTLVILLQPETFPLLLLKWKAQHLRRLTGDDRYRAESEIVHQTLWQRLRVALTRPFALALEPIVMLMTIYLTMLYIVLFTFLDGFTFIYSDVYKTPQGLTNVLFVAMFIGVLLGMPLVGVVYSWTRKDLARIRAHGGSQINPEYRLWFAMFGGSIGIPLSLFWMAWTDYSSISIWSPIAAGVPFGYGIICIFLSAYMYIIDSYEMYAASALTFVTLVRYVVAGGMTVVGIPFYKNLGTHWTLTILGCISVLMAPIPYLFYKKGYEIRKRSKFAVNREE
ncbi:major facilitator superfamily transporter [Mytilinidion resinicola]|uniref:Major facilitator superfamily transporter n=1 Tax=Mytilinidion resinicola TaxID=574789 RepID=A0A6A6XZ90_9PEZI|nr:major facilitator superfamily transporter [Mytilinidion resinicola]KAF2801608.1 major facilitator superfamily transporter [Mytilinidion resinicola]